MKLKTFFAITALLASNLAFANPVTLNLNIVNNTPQSWNPVANENFDSIGPIVTRNGGNTHWVLSVDDSKLVPFYIYYSARGGLYTWCETGNGPFALNPANYDGDSVTITVSGNIESSGLTCDCTGSACDVGFTAYKQSTK